MLHKLRDWVKGRSSSNTPLTPQQAQHAAQEKREGRAQHVTDLQAQVRSLQQQITDLTNGMESDNEDKGRQVDPDRLAELQDQLEDKQRELAELQGRV